MLSFRFLSVYLPFTPVWKICMNIAERKDNALGSCPPLGGPGRVSGFRSHSNFIKKWLPAEKKQPPGLSGGSRYIWAIGQLCILAHRNTWFILVW